MPQSFTFELNDKLFDNLDFLNSDLQRIFQEEFQFKEIKTLADYIDTSLDLQKFLLPEKVLEKVRFWY